MNEQSTPPSEDYQVLLPVPGGPGGPVVPPFETPEENIAAVGGCEQGIFQRLIIFVRKFHHEGYA